jgi:MFS family permease
MFAFAGQVAGDLLSGFLSQHFKSRKKIILIFISLSFLMVLTYLLVPLSSVTLFYAVCFCLGIFNGYWTLFITVAAELFGTNLRATVATTVPNFVRGAVIPLTSLFIFGKNQVGILYSALGVGLLAFAIALIALKNLEETFSKDLDYTEQD